MNNLHINISWSGPLLPRGPITAFQLQIEEQPSDPSNVNSDMSKVSCHNIQEIIENTLF